jgi:hypothetical protein
VHAAGELAQLLEPAGEILDRAVEHVGDLQVLIRAGARQS